jgi:hypothetical protein
VAGSIGGESTARERARRRSSSGSRRTLGGGGAAHSTTSSSTATAACLTPQEHAVLTAALSGAVAALRTSAWPQAASPATESGDACGTAAQREARRKRRAEIKSLRLASDGGNASVRSLPEPDDDAAAGALRQPRATMEWVAAKATADAAQMAAARAELRAYAASVLQAWWRMTCAQARWVGLRFLAVGVQRLWRGHAARRRCCALRDEAEEAPLRVQQQLEQAAGVTLTSFARMVAHRAPFRRHWSTELACAQQVRHAAAVTLQAFARMLPARRALVEALRAREEAVLEAEYAAYLHAVAALQARWRGALTRRALARAQAAAATAAAAAVAGGVGGGPARHVAPASRIPARVGPARATPAAPAVASTSAAPPVPPSTAAPAAPASGGRPRGGGQARGGALSRRTVTFAEPARLSPVHASSNRPITTHATAAAAATAAMPVAPASTSAAAPPAAVRGPLRVPYRLKLAADDDMGDDLHAAAATLPSPPGGAAMNMTAFALDTADAPGGGEPGMPTTRLAGSRHGAGWLGLHPRPGPHPPPPPQQQQQQQQLFDPASLLDITAVVAEDVSNDVRGATAAPASPLRVVLRAAHGGAAPATPDCDARASALDRVRAAAIVIATSRRRGKIASAVSDLADLCAASSAASHHCAAMRGLVPSLFKLMSESAPAAPHAAATASAATGGWSASAARLVGACARALLAVAASGAEETLVVAGAAGATAPLLSRLAQQAPPTAAPAAALAARDETTPAAALHSVAQLVGVLMARSASVRAAVVGARALY